MHCLNLKHFVDKVQDLGAISEECIKCFAYLNVRLETFPNHNLENGTSPNDCTWSYKHFLCRYFPESLRC